MKVINKNTISFKSGYLIVLLGLSTCIVSCTSHDDNISDDVTNDEYRTINLVLPETNYKKTYTISELDENKVVEADILVFKVDGADETYLYRSAASTITDNNASGSLKKVVLKVSNSSPHQVRFVVVANAHAQIEAANLQVGETKTTVLNKLEFGTNGKWPAANATEFVPFPMWGETETTIEITSTTNVFPPVKIMRSIARIDIGLKYNDISTDPQGMGTQFTLEEVYVYNSVNKGLIAPLPTNVANNSVTAPTLPVGYTLNTPAVYTTADIDPDKKSLLRTIYLAESPAGLENNRTTAPFIIVGGSFNGEPTGYYRIDYIKPVASGDIADTYVPILRNHRYVFNINRVDNNGYATINEAIENRSLNGMEVKQTFYDESIGSLSYDGSYLLGMSSHELRVNFNAHPSITMKAFTDAPNGWLASIDATAYPWLRIKSGAIGVQHTTSDIELEIDQNLTGAERIAEMKVKFGRMTETVKIYQSNTLVADGNITIVDQDSILVDDPTFNEQYKINFRYSPRIPWKLPLNYGIIGSNFDSYDLNTYDAYAGVSISSMNGGPIDPLPTITIDSTATWIHPRSRTRWNDKSSYDGGVIYGLQFDVDPMPDYTNMANSREVQVTIEWRNIKKVVTLKQDMPQMVVPKGYAAIDNIGNETVSTNSLMFLTHEKTFANWYELMNIPNYYNGDDIAGNQVSPPRDKSCVWMGHINYAGHNDWRMPTYNEMARIIKYVHNDRLKRLKSQNRDHRHIWYVIGANSQLKTADHDSHYNDTFSKVIGSNGYLSFMRLNLKIASSFSICVRTASELD